MPNLYEVELDDGSLYEVEANSEGEARNKALRSVAPEPAPQMPVEAPPSAVLPEREAFDKLSTYEQTMVGAGQNINELYQGTKQMLGVEPTQQEQAEITTADRGIHGLPAAMGEIATEAPAMIASGGLGAVTKFPKMVEAGLMAGHEFAKAPSEDTSRLDRAGASLVGSGASQVFMNKLSKLWRGLNPSKEGKILDKAGIDATPGQRGGPLMQSAEVTLGRSGLTKSATRELQQEAMQQWNDKLWRELSVASGHRGFSGGAKGYKQVGDQLDANYTKIWDQNFNIDTDSIKAALVEIRKNAGLIGGQSEIPRTNKLITEIVQDLKTTQNKDGTHKGRVIDMIDSRLKADINRYYDHPEYKNPRMGELLKQMQDALLDALPPNVRADLVKNDKMWAKYKSLQEVTAKSHGRAFKPDAIQQELASKGNRRSIIEGQNEFINEVSQVRDAFERVDVDIMAPDAGRVVATLASAFLTGGGKMVGPAVSKALAGKHVPQEWIKKLADEMKKRGFDATTIGAAVGAATDANEAVE